MSNAPLNRPAGKLLVSACLLGNPVRYDGKSKRVFHDGLQRLQDAGRLLAFCPEMAGGLPVPRAPAEIIGGDGLAVMNGEACVKTQSGADVSRYFIDGARRALKLCQSENITVAVLTERSPSCGSSQVYDGSFSRQDIDGSGVTTALLRENGIEVFNQYQFDQAIAVLDGG